MCQTDCMCSLFFILIIIMHHWANIRTTQINLCYLPTLQNVFIVFCKRSKIWLLSNVHLALNVDFLRLIWESNSYSSNGTVVDKPKSTMRTLLQLLTFYFQLVLPQRNTTVILLTFLHTTLLHFHFLTLPRTILICHCTANSRSSQIGLWTIMS